LHSHCATSLNRPRKTQKAFFTQAPSTS